jgi:hypothetical protein
MLSQHGSTAALLVFALFVQYLLSNKPHLAYRHLKLLPNLCFDADFCFASWLKKRGN